MLPRYELKAPTFVCDNMHAAGDIVEYDGWPGSTLEPVDDVAKRIKEYFAAHRRDRKLPRKPDLAMFAEPEPAKPDYKSHAPASRKPTVKDDTDG